MCVYVHLPAGEKLIGFGPVTVARRCIIGLEDSLADCERIRIIGAKLSSLLRFAAVLQREIKEENIQLISVVHYCSYSRVFNSLIKP